MVLGQLDIKPMKKTPWRLMGYSAIARVLMLVPWSQFSMVFQTFAKSSPYLQSNSKIGVWLACNMCWFCQLLLKMGEIWFVPVVQQPCGRTLHSLGGGWKFEPVLYCRISRDRQQGPHKQICVYTLWFILNVKFKLFNATKNFTCVFTASRSCCYSESQSSTSGP